MDFNCRNMLDQNKEIYTTPRGDLGELAKRYAWILRNAKEYGNTPDIVALSWVCNVKVCVYNTMRIHTKPTTGADIGPSNDNGVVFNILNYEDSLEHPSPACRGRMVNRS